MLVNNRRRDPATRALLDEVARLRAQGASAPLQPCTPAVTSIGDRPTDDELFHVVLSEHQPLGDTHPALRAWIERIAALPSAYPAP